MRAKQSRCDTQTIEIKHLNDTIFATYEVVKQALSEHNDSMEKLEYYTNMNLNRMSAQARKIDVVFKKVQMFGEKTHYLEEVNVYIKLAQ